MSDTLPTTSSLLFNFGSGGAYTPPNTVVDFNFPRLVAPVGIASNVFGTAGVRNWAQFVGPYTIPALDVGLPLVKSELRFFFGGSSYVPPSPPETATLIFSFSGAYFVSVGSIPPLGFGASLVYNSRQYVRPEAFTSYGIGTPNTYTYNLIAAPVGIPPIATGTPTVINKAVGVFPAGIAPLVLPAPNVFLWRRYVYPYGYQLPDWDGRNSGTVLNWRQPTYPSSFTSDGVGYPGVVLKTATQIVNVYSGIGVGNMGVPIVSPQYVYPVQFNSSGYGTPNVQLPPRPVGFDSSAFGRPTVLDNHQTVTVTGFVSFDYGVPSTKRLQEYVYPPSFVESTLFGDARPILRQRYVPMQGFDASFISPFGSVTNRNRQVLPFPITAIGAGTAIAANKSPNLTPPGIASLKFGAADIGYNVRPILFAGAINPGLVGTANVKNAAATVAPYGFDALLTTPPMVSYRIRYVQAVGTLHTQYGNSTIWFRVRGISSVGGSDTALYGRASFDLKDRRVLDAGAGFGTVIPSPTVWYGVRTVGLENLGIGWDIGRQFGGTRVQDATQRLLGAGAIAPGLFGFPDARRNEVLVYPAGIAGEFGSTTTDLWTRYVAARSFLNEEIFGQAKFHNDRQYIAPFMDPDSVLLQGGVGVPWDVSNRNRTITTIGADMSLLSRTGTVELTGRDIHPVGLDSMTFGTTVLGARVRYVGAEGWDSFFSRFTAVYNRSAVLEPSGIRAGQAGVPAIKDTRQFMDAVGGNDHARYGQQFVSYRIRTIVITPGIEAPRLIDIDVALRKRYLAPPSIEGGLGVPFVESHRNLIGPKGYPMDSYGGALVRNLTPEVAVYATLLTEYGKPTVFNRRAYVAPAGFSTIWGGALVDFRVKFVKPGGFEALRIPTHNVQFDAPQLPPQQLVAPEGVKEDEYGRPSLQLRGMYVVGIDAVKFGSPTCISYGIGPVTLPFDANKQFGTPSLNGTQTVAVTSIEFKQVNENNPAKGDGANWIGTARITPYTITLEPARYAEHEVDYTPGQARHPWWGSAVVTQRLRSIQMYGYDPYNLFGTPDVQLRKRYVNAIGLNSFKYGVPSIPSNWTVYPFWGRTTEQEVPGVNIDPARYGTADVARPIVVGPGRIYPAGFAGAFGEGTHVDLFNRRITGAGAIYGTVFTGDTWVHPPIKVFPTGFESLQMGKLATGLKYRYIQVDSTDLDTHWGVEFNGGVFPMKVRLRGKTIAVASIPAGNIGAQYVGLRQQPVQAAGDDFGVLPMPAVLGKAKIAPEGFNSLQMGTPKQPVYGVVEPQGEDMLTFGRVGLGLGFRVPGLTPGGLGLANVQRGVIVTGMHGDFGSTVVVGESNCGSTLAVIAQLGDTSKFGTHGVHR